MNIIEKIKEKLKEIFRKTKKGLAIGGTIATVGMVAGCGADKDAEVVDNSAKIEQEANGIESQNESKENEWKKGLAVEQGSITPSQLTTVESEIDEIETSEDLEKYFNSIYAKKYEEITGEKLNPESITISLNEEPQTYIYVTENGERVTHGATPYDTEEALDSTGCNYHSEEDVDIYTVLNEENEIIDAITIESDEPIKVIPGDNYEEMKGYTSTFEELGNVSVAAISYHDKLEKMEKEGETEFSEKQCKAAKNNFIEAIKEQNNKEKSAEEDYEIE